MAESIRPRSVSDLVGQTIQLTFRCFPKLLAIYAIYSFVAIAALAMVVALYYPELTEFVTTAEQNPEDFPVAALLLLMVVAVVVLLLAAIPAAAAIPAISEQFISHRVTLGECFAVGLRKLWTVLSIQLVVGLLAMAVPLVGMAIVMAGMFGELIAATLVGVVVLFGGFFISMVVFCKYFVAIQAAVVEDLGIGAAMQRSAALTLGRRWNVFAVLFIVGCISGAISMATSMVTLVCTAIFGDTEATRWIIVSVEFVMTVISQVVATLLAAVSAVAVYFDLRGRTEDFDAENLERLVDEVGRGVRPTV